MATCPHCGDDNIYGGYCLSCGWDLRKSGARWQDDASDAGQQASDSAEDQQAGGLAAEDEQEFKPVFKPMPSDPDEDVELSDEQLDQFESSTRVIWEEAAAQEAPAAVATPSPAPAPTAAPKKSGSGMGCFWVVVVLAILFFAVASGSGGGATSGGTTSTETTDNAEVSMAAQFPTDWSGTFGGKVGQQMEEVPFWVTLSVDEAGNLSGVCQVSTYGSYNVRGSVDWSTGYIWFDWDSWIDQGTLTVKRGFTGYFDNSSGSWTMSGDCAGADGRNASTWQLFA